VLEDEDIKSASSSTGSLSTGGSAVHTAYQPAPVIGNTFEPPAVTTSGNSSIAVINTAAVGDRAATLSKHEPALSHKQQTVSISSVLAACFSSVLIDCYQQYYCCSVAPCGLRSVVE